MFIHREMGDFRWYCFDITMTRRGGLTPEAAAVKYVEKLSELDLTKDYKEYTIIDPPPMGARERHPKKNVFIGFGPVGGRV